MKYHLFALVFLTQFLRTYLSAQISGLQADYYSGRDFDKKIISRVDPAIDFYWKPFATPALGVDHRAYSIRWTGKLKAPVTGIYTFTVMVDDGVRVWIGSQKVIDAWSLNDEGNFTGSVPLEMGKDYDLKVEYFNAVLEGEIHLLWELPTEKPIFGGFFGRNFKPITPQYFSHTPIPTPIEKKQAIPPKAKPTPPTPKPKINLATATQYSPQNVHFEKSTAKLLADSYTELDLVAEMLKKYPRKKITVEGHTDYIGDSLLNQRLSEERAQAVANYLIQKGISEKRITVKGYGGSRPLSQDDSPEAHAKNRRVAFLIQ
jgi:outer membrane protein OmpA-like peptidoglycan-associated protein